MFCVYILQSQKDGKYYIGYTENIEIRLKWHNEGRNKSTAYRRPLKLVHSENFLTKQGAMQREKQIKLYKGGNEFKKLIQGSVA